MGRRHERSGRGIPALLRFAALLVPVAPVIVAVVLLDRVVAAIRFELNQGGLVSCSVGMGGITVSCETSAAIRYAVGGVIAAAITACAARVLDASRPAAVGRLRDELLIAALGPFAVLHAGAGFVLCYFGLFWGGVRSWTPDFLIGLLTPYAAGAVLGTLGFWAVLRLLRARPATGKDEGSPDPSRNATAPVTATATATAPAPAPAASDGPTP